MQSTSIIEVGCGTGEFLYPLFNETKYVVGVDVNPAFIEWCEQHAPPLQKQVQFITGDAQHLTTLLKAWKTVPKCENLYNKLTNWCRQKHTLAFGKQNEL